MSSPPALPSLRALRAFRAAATHQTLALAAASLGVTESAVSHQIRQLEDLLNTPLFDRLGGRLHLNGTGQRYLTGVTPALAALEEATRQIAPRAASGVVRVTLPTSMAATWLLPRLATFEAAHPDLEVQLLPTTRVVDLAAERVDIAIRYGHGGWPDVETEFLFPDLATPVAHPDLIAPGADPAQALSGVRLIVNRSVPDEWGEWARARGIDPPPLTEALMLDSIEQVLQVAVAGHGMGMGRSPYIDEPLARRSLIAPFGRPSPSDAGYYLCRARERTPTAGARRMIRWLKAQAAEWFGTT